MELDIDPQEVRKELQRILSSSNFETSDRNRRFLEYIVEETLAGRADRIKAYNVATDVFGRGSDFDPQLDPVVRMEARRLRRALERFYLLDPSGGPIRISIPCGGYVPRFEIAVSRDLARYSERPAKSETSVHIRVLPFTGEGDHPTLSSGLTCHITIGLHQAGEIVLSGEGGGNRLSPSELCQNMNKFVLTGSLAASDIHISATALLVEAATGRVFWGRRFDRTVPADNVLAERDKVGDAIILSLTDFLHRSVMMFVVKG